MNKKRRKRYLLLLFIKMLVKMGYRSSTTVLWVKGEVWQSSRGSSSHHSDSDSEGSVQENRNSDLFRVTQIQQEVFKKIEIQIYSE